MKHLAIWVESVEARREVAVPVRVAARRVHCMIGYMSIFGAAISGYADLGVWTVAATAIALASLSQAEYSTLYRRGKELGLTEVTLSTALQSFANALIAATSAYAMGWIFRLI